jgi:hypothetical protein
MGYECRRRLRRNLRRGGATKTKYQTAQKTCGKWNAFRAPKGPVQRAQGRAQRIDFRAVSCGPSKYSCRRSPAAGPASAA